MYPDASPPSPAQSANFCTHCGQARYADAAFCSNCGQPFDEQTPPHATFPSRDVAFEPPRREFVESHLTKAIIVTALCFLPTGIVAIQHALRAESYLKEGDIHCARIAANEANRWCNRSITICFVLIGLAILIPISVLLIALL